MTSHTQLYSVIHAIQIFFIFALKPMFDVKGHLSHGLLIIWCSLFKDFTELLRVVFVLQIARQNSIWKVLLEKSICKLQNASSLWMTAEWSVLFPCQMLIYLIRGLFWIIDNDCLHQQETSCYVLLEKSAVHDFTQPSPCHHVSDNAPFDSIVVSLFLKVHVLSF